MVSNVALSCSNGSNNCATAQAQTPPNGTYANGDFSMAYMDIDADAGTFMSSSDSIALPNCSEILWAGLYWSARIAANTANYANRSQVRLKLNNGAYQVLTADQTLDVPISILLHSFTLPHIHSFSNPGYTCLHSTAFILSAP